MVKTDLLVDSPNDLDAVFVQNLACSRNILGKPKADPKYGPRDLKEGAEFTDLKKLAGIGTTQKTSKSNEMFDLKKLAGI